MVTETALLVTCVRLVLAELQVLYWSDGLHPAI